MLRPHHSLAIYMEGYLGERPGKMGYGVLRFSKNPIACVIDSRHAGKDVRDVIDVGRSCPVVAGVAEAADLGADVLLLGIAPSGGRIPEQWHPVVQEAIDRGMSIINGLHDRLGTKFTDRPGESWIWDLRCEPEGVSVASGAARLLPGKRVLLVGSDMAIGKMTAGLLLHQAALDRGVKAEFVATGQIGIAICGRGVALDAVRLDYAAGAIEKSVLEVSDAEMIFLEGQGSLLHPASSATLPLIRGLCPTHLVMCTRADAKTLATHPWVEIPPLDRLITLYEDLAESCGAYQRPKTPAICVNTSHLADEDAREYLADLSEQTGRLADDPVRFGAGRLIEALLAE
jgi:uncharacterized NAD-dependent epimerase/dehydratase family protein